MIARRLHRAAMDRARMLHTHLVALTAAAVLTVGFAAGQSPAGGPARVSDPARPQVPVKLDSMYYYYVTPSETNSGQGPFRGCSQVSTHTDALFEGDTYVAQGGFAEQEVAAASYTIPADAFPIKIELIEMIFVTVDTVVPTTTRWSVMVWDGTPTNGTLVATYSSDGLLLPHLELPPGTNGANIAFGIDPSDPEQIIISNTSGTNTFTVGYRIDEHNNQTQNPCFVPPPSDSNAFPVTDFTGLAAPAGNWLFGVNCGQFGCPPNGGWATFSQLAVGCRPSGDWVIRATWSPTSCQPGAGACCLPNGECETRLASDCAAAGGVYQGDGVSCGTVNCPEPTGACCFGSSCLNLSEADCVMADGVYLGNGTACASGNSCPTGACCLPDGSCLDGLSAGQCKDLGGTFWGVGTECATAGCPQPLGACCLATGGCLRLSEDDCGIIPDSFWAGDGTTCADNNGNGQADDCESPACPGDVTGDLVVDFDDLVAFLAAYSRCDGDPGYDPRADLDGDLCVDFSDLVALLATYGSSCGP